MRAAGDDEPTPVEYVAAAAHYAELFGWPCVAHGYAVWARAGQAFDAVDLPAQVGPDVLGRIRRRTGCPRDVIDVPGDPDDRWRFLVLPRQRTSRRGLAALAGHGAIYLTGADRIELPPTQVARGELRWVRRPVGRLGPVRELVEALGEDG